MIAAFFARVLRICLGRPGTGFLLIRQEVRTICKTRNQLLILWVLYTGMQWKCLPGSKDINGNPAIHYTTVYKVFAKWADDGSLWQAFIASVAHLAAEKQLDLRVLHGDGTNTVAKKGGMALGIRGTNTRRARKSSRSSTIMGMS